MKDALALALVHFIWQGAVLAVVAWVLMRVAKLPSVRYAIGVATMVAMLATLVITCAALQSASGVTGEATTGLSSSPTTSGGRDQSPSARVSAGGSTAIHPASRSSAVILPTDWILNVWVFGVAVLSLRSAGGLAVAHRLATRTLTPVSEDLQRLAARMAVRLNVRRVVRVCESASVAVPVMIGWLRPVIVLPETALAALPASQLEALLAHEFAHIRRHDYLVNLLQTGVETLCFYHPAVRWVSREVRRHREQCCDDLAVGVCDRLTYVSALSALASISTPQFALAATGGSLRDRVRRLIEPTTDAKATKGAWMAMLPILLVVSLVAPHAWGQSASAAVPVVTVEQIAAPVVQAPPVPPVVVQVPVEVQRRPVTQRETRRAEVPVRARVAVETPRRPRVERPAQATDLARRNEETRTALRARRVELEVQTEQVAARREITLLQSQLRQQEAELTRTRRLFETGLATQEAVVAAEEHLVRARSQLEAARAHMAIREQEHNLKRAEASIESRAHAELQLAERKRAGHLNLSALDPSAALQPQDQLIIAIADEPELPTHFTVRADGSIRFPLLGHIRVQGSTIAEVQSAIQQLIRDKGLARNASVSVSARRGR